MKKSLVIVFILIMLVSCGPSVYPPSPLEIRKDIPSILLASIRSSSQNVGYIVEDANPNPLHLYRAFEYGSNKQTLSPMTFKVNIIDDIEKRMKTYTDTKYLMTTANNPDVSMVVTLKDIYFEYSIASAPNATALLIMTNTYNFTTNLRTNMIVNVLLIKKGQTFKKEFSFVKDVKDDAVHPSSLQPQKATIPVRYAQNPNQVFSDQLSEIYNELIIRVDKFVDAVN